MVLIQGFGTFSIFNVTGEGFAAVMASAISAPIRNASSLERPGRCTNKLSVSPYTTLACHLRILKSVLQNFRIAVVLLELLCIDKANTLLKEENSVFAELTVGTKLLLAFMSSIPTTLKQRFNRKGN